MLCKGQQNLRKGQPAFERQAVQAEAEAVQADEAPMGLETDDDKLLADFEEALREVQATEARPVDKYTKGLRQKRHLAKQETRKKKAVYLRTVQYLHRDVRANTKCAVGLSFISSSL